MTKQEQVKEILEVIKHCGDYTNRDCAECDYRLYGECKNQKQCEAEALYNAGYGNISEYKAEREMLGSQIKVLKQRLNDKYIEIDNLNRDYRNAFERLKSQQREIERLKAENETYCKQINQAYDTGYDDGYESCQDDIKKADVRPL